MPANILLVEDEPAIQELIAANLNRAGHHVVRGFVFAMLWGVFVGTYSTVYVAKSVVLWLGVKRDWSKDGDGPKKNVSPFEGAEEV